MSIPDTSPLCATCTQALQPAQAMGDYYDPWLRGQSLEMFREAASGSCFICSSLWWIAKAPARAWRNIDEASWSRLNFQIEREDSEGESSTFTVYVNYAYPSDENKWSLASSTYRLIRFDGMVAVYITVTSGAPSTWAAVAHSNL